jgi:hypothetical protein
MNRTSGSLDATPSLAHPLQFVLVALAGWMANSKRDVIAYLQEEHRVLREQLGPRRLRFTDDQRRRLAAKARTLGRRMFLTVSRQLWSTPGPARVRAQSN